MDLFTKATEDNQEPGSQPLAARMRPRNLDEYAGQDHIVGPGRLLRRAIQADQLSSLIFFGPPGTGKTTLARVIANTTKSHFSTLNAVLSGVKQIREEIEAAKDRQNLYGRRTILFVDEVHRWNKSQQDALLPWVENGTFILIGATTENPYFEVNSALVSRSRVFQLRPLEAKDLEKIVDLTLSDQERGYGRWKVSLTPEARRHLIDVADGDARSLLNALELAIETTPEAFPPPPDTPIEITLPIAEESIQKKALLYDKEGDYHFDIISAFIKSIRGSDPDAALYWMARMIRSGEDPRFVFRRMLISACEDVGLADPQALVQVQAAAAAFDRIGMPEGAFHLTQACLYLTAAPKSNSALGYFDAVKAVEQEEQQQVPNHLKDPNRDGREFGHGKGYLYPHAYRDHWVAQAYLPEALQGRIFYKPGAKGWEGSRRAAILERREEQINNALPAESQEVLTFSPESRRRGEWIRRITTSKGRSSREIWTALLDEAPLQRHHRLLLPRTQSGLIPGEALRRVPEGLVWILAGSSSWHQILEHYLQTMDPAEQPRLELSPPQGELPPPDHFGEIRFEALLAEDWLTRRDQWEPLLAQAAPLLAPEGFLLLSQIIPSRAQRLSALLPPPEEKEEEKKEILISLSRAEEKIYTGTEDPRTGWDTPDLREALLRSGWTLDDCREEALTETRQLSGEVLDQWLPPRESLSPEARFAQALIREIGEGKYSAAVDYLKENLQGKEVPWRSIRILIRARLTNPGKTVE